MAVLVIEKGKEKGKKLSLYDGDKVIVGRDKFCHLMIDDMLASRKHFQIESRNGHHLIRDLGSSNGTLVNGKKVKVHSLEVNDRIQIGDSLLSFMNEEKSIDQTSEFKEGLIAGYRIQDRIGRGGMGTVYLAEQVSLQRKVALKLLAKDYASDKNFVALFIEEARAAGQLNHPNIVQVYDVGQVGSTYYFSMEYMSQGSVEDLVNQQGRLEPDRAISLVLQAAKGLDYAEKKRIIHRDIKPANLMLGEDDLVKIGDLGIAKRLHEHQETAEIEGIAGSPHYIAPEHALGKPIDHRVDIYSLGVTFYQLLCGRTPYRGKSAKEIILKHVEEDPHPLEEANPDLPGGICDIVKKMMEKEPGQRYSNASQVIESLENWKNRKKILGDSAPSMVPPPVEADTQSDKETEVLPAFPEVLAEKILPFVKKNSHLFLSLLILLFFSFAVYFLNQQIHRLWHQKLSKLYGESQDLFKKGSLEDAARLCRELQEKDPQGIWNQRARELMKRIEGKKARRAKKQLARLDQDAKKALAPLKEAVQNIQYEEDCERVLNRISEFLAGYGRSSLASKAKALIEEARQKKEELINQKKSREKLLRDGRREFEKTLERARVEILNHHYGKAIQVLDAYPSIYQKTPFFKDLEALKNSYRQRGRKKFWEYFRSTSLYQQALQIDEMYQQRKFSLLLDRIARCLKALREQESEILRRADEFGLEEVKKDSASYLGKLENSLKVIRSQVRKTVLQQERKLFLSTLERSRKYIENFDLQEALSKLNFAKKMLTSSQYQNELDYYARGVMALQDLQKKLIDHINAKKKRSKIYRYLEKYGTVVWGVAVRADATQIVFESDDQKNRHYASWRELNPTKLILYFTMMEEAVGLSARNCFALGFYAVQMKIREEAIRFLGKALSLNAQKAGTPSYDGPLEKDISFFMRRR